jgi:hypothetical protein
MQRGPIVALSVLKASGTPEKAYRTRARIDSMKVKKHIKLRKGMEDWRMERECSRESCKNLYLPKREIQVHCSPACRRLAWNESRVTMRITKEAAKQKSLASDFRNPLIAMAGDRLSLLSRDSKDLLTRCCMDFAIAGKKRARECARLENYHEAEHWRAVSVFAEQIRKWLSR